MHFSASCESAGFYQMDNAKVELRAVFSEIFETGGWATTETVSGPGSTIESTNQIRPAISTLCRQHNIRSILDIPCGDFNWMSRMDFSGIQYIGADIVPQLVDLCRRRHPLHQFEVLDICSDNLPAADLVLCRDCLVHLTFAEIMSAIHNVISSGSKWLLSTQFSGRVNYDIPTGTWRPLDLCAAPINLPAPHAIINEGCREGYGEFSDKSLGLWSIRELATQICGSL